MDDDTAKTPFEQIVELLNAHGVEFVIIGGQAETLPPITCYNPGHETRLSA